MKSLYNFTTMRNLITALLFCLFTLTASAKQGELIGVRIGNTDLTQGLCNNLPFSSGTYPVFLLVRQTSANTIARQIDGIGTVSGGGTPIQLSSTTKDVPLGQDETVAVPIGSVTLVRGVQYTFQFSATICYNSNCDRNQNNSFDDNLTFCATPLPVELSSFTATNTAQATRLNWTTASEKNSNHFSVQMSNDGRVFRQIGTVLAAGNSSSARSYSFVNNRVDGLTYYRLKTIDNDNTSAYSPIITVAPVSMGAEYLAGANGRYVAFHLLKGETPEKLYILDTTGRVLYEQDFDQIIRYPLGEKMVIIRMVTSSGSQYNKVYR